MIYLLKSPSWKPGYIRYKVGYAKDVQRRFQQYEPETYLVGTRPGEVMDEQILHRRLKLLPGIKILRNEWYIVKEDDNSLLKTFHESKLKIEEEVWKTLEHWTDVNKDTYLYLKSLGFQSNKTLLRERSKLNINEILNSYTELSNSENLQDNVRTAFKELSIGKTILSRLKFLCEGNLDNDVLVLVLDNMPDIDIVKYLYTMAGPNVCKANSYQPKRILNKIEIRTFNKSDIAKEIYSIFKVGDNLSLSDIKGKIRNLYDKIGYNKTPKANDIEEFFDVKRTKIVVSGKSIHSYKLLKKLL